MAMWVWRLPNKDDGTWNNPPAQPWECRRLAMNRLFQNQELTLGWGMPELDLNLPEQQWVKKRYDWDHAAGGTMTMIAAQKDYNLMIPIRTDIQIGDTIFLPKVGANRLSDDHFVVVTVAGRYLFIKRGQYPRHLNQYTWDQDYGHVIPVDGNLTRTFPYSQNTLQSGDFGAPFLKRQVKVPDHRFYQFLQNQNYPFIP